MGSPEGLIVAASGRWFGVKSLRETKTHVVVALAALMVLAACSPPDSGVVAAEPTAVAGEPTTVVAAGDEEVAYLWTDITGPNSFTTDNFGAIWDVEITGIVRVPSSGSNDCQVLIGTMVYQGADLYAEFQAGPDILLHDGVENLYPVGRSICVVGDITQMGYGEIDRAEVTPGTAYAFYVAYETALTPEHIVIGPTWEPELRKTLAVEVMDEVPVPELVSLSQPLAGLQDVSAPDLRWQDLRWQDWSLRIDGLVRYDNCVVIVGSFTPEAEDGGLVEFKYQPTFGLIVDGQYTRNFFSDCRSAEPEAAGYNSPKLRDLRANSAYNFYRTVAIPQSGVVEALIIGQGSSHDGALTLTAPLSQSMPTASAPVSASLGELPALASATGTVTKQETTWEVRLDGMIETGPSIAGERPGRCVDIYGTMTPIAIENLGTITSQYTVPEIGVLQDGAFVGTRFFKDCDHAAVEAAGYRTTEQLNVVAGTVHAFYESVFIPDGPVDAVIVNSDNDDGITAQSDFATTVEPVDTSWSNTMAFDPAQLVGTRYEYSDRDSGWDYELSGMVEVDVATPEASGERCFAVFGTSTSTRNSYASGVTKASNGPPLIAISDGYMLGRGSDRCDSQALEEAGYGPLDDTELGVGDSYPFYVMFLIPADREIDVVAVGRALRPYDTRSPAIYVEPSVSDQITPAN